MCEPVADSRITSVLLFKPTSSPGEELQSREHDDPEPPRAPAGRRRRVHRVRQADTVHGQVSLIYLA